MANDQRLLHTAPGGAKFTPLDPDYSLCRRAPLEPSAVYQHKETGINRRSNGFVPRNENMLGDKENDEKYPDLPFSWYEEAPSQRLNRKVQSLELKTIQSRNIYQHGVGNFHRINPSTFIASLPDRFLKPTPSTPRYVYQLLASTHLVPPCWETLELGHLYGWSCAVSQG